MSDEILDSHAGSDTERLPLGDDPSTRASASFDDDLPPRPARQTRNFSSVLWRVVAINIAALIAVFALAYSAGRWSGGLSMLDFGGLPYVAGLRLWGAALVAVIGICSLVWLASRVLEPVNKLRLFSEHFNAPEHERPELPDTADDFGAIAANLREAADLLAKSKVQHDRLADLRMRISAFAAEAKRVSAGDLSVRFAEDDEDLRDALKSLNASLELMNRVLDGARVLAENSAATSQQSMTSLQQVSRTLMQQQTELAAGVNAFDVLPPSIKQVQDNSESLSRAAQSAATSVDQGRQVAAVIQADLQRMGVSLHGAADVLSNVRAAADRVISRLSALSTVTEHANLLALNAAIEAARAGQAGRSSWIFAEQFRDLAQQSNDASAELESLMEAVQHDCASLAATVGENAQLATESARAAAKSAETADNASGAIHEAAARAEVIGMAASRQADAARTVGASMQSSADLQKSADLKARQVTAVAEELVKLHNELQAALRVIRSTPSPDAGIKARAASTQS